LAPATLNLEFYQGDTFSRSFRLWTDSAHTVPRNLAGYTAKAQLRLQAAPTADLLAEFTAQISGSPTANTITISLSSAQTSGIVQTSGWYDVQIKDGSNNVETLVRGKVTITPEITVNA
jgi:hypothetical protein